MFTVEQRKVRPMRFVIMIKYFKGFHKKESLDFCVIVEPKGYNEDQYVVEVDFDSIYGKTL